MTRKAKPPKAPKGSNMSMHHMGTDVLFVSEYSSMAYAPAYQEDTVGQVNIMMTIKGRYNKTSDRGILKIAMSREDAYQFLKSVSHSIRYSIEREQEFLDNQLAVLNAQISKLTAELGADDPEVIFLMQMADGIHRAKGSTDSTDIHL